jgi:hypothetical protein
MNFSQPSCVVPEMFEYLKKKHGVQRSVPKGQFIRARDYCCEIGFFRVPSKGSPQCALIDISGIHLTSVSTEISRKYAGAATDVGNSPEVLPEELIYVDVLGWSLK